MKMISTEVKNLEPIKTIAISHVGEYSGICTAFTKLGTWAGQNNLWAASPKMAGVYHDCPSSTPVDKLRSEACIEDLSGTEPGEGMKQYTISGGKYFVMQMLVTFAELGEAWEKVNPEIKEKGYEFDQRDFYELYVKCEGDMQDNNSPWVVDICIPVK